MDNLNYQSMDNNSRKEPRFKGAVVEYSYLNDHVKKSTFTIDISTQGASIFVNESINLNTILELDFYLLGNKDIPISVKGKIIRQRLSSYSRPSDQAYYDIGIKFIDITEENKKRLSHLLENN